MLALVIVYGRFNVNMQNLFAWRICEQATRQFWEAILCLHEIAQTTTWGAVPRAAGDFTIEVCSFPDPPNRLAWPEAAGLRHLAFEAEDFDGAIKKLNDFGISTEPVRIDKRTGKRYTFFHDPDNQPLEIYE